MVVVDLIGNRYRIDSSKGYTLDNVVPCCWMCNNMKHNYDQDKFLEHCEKVYKHSRGT